MNKEKQSNRQRKELYRKSKWYKGKNNPKLEELVEKVAKRF